MRSATVLDWHALPVGEALAQLDSSTEGLTQAGAEERLALHGPNRLPEARRRSPFVRFLLQFHNLLIYVLLAAGALSLSIGHITDAVLIGIVVLVNAIIGYLQEGRAEKALEAIRAMIDPHASVLRDGRRCTVPADRLVPGDVVLLEAGDRVPADLRLLRTSTLHIDEAILTGESVPAEKSPLEHPASSGLGDRRSMAFSGTAVAVGQGAGVVVATGATTELGRISSMIEAVEELATPLLRQMSQFARQVTFAVLALSVFVFVYAISVQGYLVPDALMAVVGLAVASIPEGLPAVMTITLAAGVQRMARRNAIIRHLPAVETLGAVSIICSDKTGTLTRNEMMAHSVVTNDSDLKMEGSGYRPEGHFLNSAGRPVTPADDPVLMELALGALLCNDASLRQGSTGWTVEGDPMEGALLSLAIKAGYFPAEARASARRIADFPFDSRHRYMATLNVREGGQAVAYIKGAPERILEMCAAVASRTGDALLDREVWLERVNVLAANGQRVIALASRTFPAGQTTLEPGDIQASLTLLGLVGLIDPPRPEAVAAIAQCRTAGIRVKMITGDHAETARAIAVQLGLADEPRAVTGKELDALGDEAFGVHARETTVFARTTPEHKLRLVSTLQADGSVIAMTGDGVNDAPALKRADVGVAMGGKGTEVAKEASEIVLADDNFASIVAAIREGRTVYDNLTKVIAWTLPTNGGAALTIVLAIVFGVTLPVTPAQILWVNMITAVALGLTLAFEPTDPGAMERPSRPPKQGILSPRLLWQVAFVSVLMVAGTFGVFTWALDSGLSVEVARTMAVNALVVMEVFYLINVRLGYTTFRNWRSLLAAPAVPLGIAAAIIVQLAYTYLPFFHTALESRPLAAAEVGIVVAIGITLFTAVELEKAIARWVQQVAPRLTGNTSAIQDASS